MERSLSNVYMRSSHRSGTKNPLRHLVHLSPNFWRPFSNETGGPYTFITTNSNPGLFTWRNVLYVYSCMLSDVRTRSSAIAEELRDALLMKKVYATLKSVLQCEIYDYFLWRGSFLNLDTVYYHAVSWSWWRAVCRPWWRSSNVMMPKSLCSVTVIFVILAWVVHRSSF